MQPTLFVDIQTDGRSVFNPLAGAIKKVAFGAMVVDKLVGEGDVEATIAVTNSVSRALNMVKETEGTTIVVGYMTTKDKKTAESLATRFPCRMRVVSMLNGDGVIAFVPWLLDLISEKTEA